MVEVGQSRSLLGDVPDGIRLESLSADQLYSIKMRLFELLGYEIHHPEVERFHKSRAKVKVVSAARRTTKSFSAAHDIMLDCIFPDKRRNIWCVGPDYGLASKEFDYIHKALVLNRKKLGLPRPVIAQNNPKTGSLYIKWPWGTILEGKSATRPESLLGDAVDKVIYSEAGQLPSKIRDKYVQPTLMTTKGSEIIPTTPENGAQWVHDLVMAGMDEKYPWVESFTWDGHANPMYDWETFEQQKLLLGEDSPIFREQFLGSWEFYGGRVYPQFKDDIHVIDPFDIPKGWRRYRGIDFGHQDPFCCLWMAVGPGGELYFYNEYHKTQGITREHAQKIIDETGDDSISMTVADRSGKQLIADLEYEGIRGMVPCNNDLQAGRMQVANYFNVSEDGIPPFPKAHLKGRFPRAYVFSNCKNLIREFKFYRWREKNIVHRQGDVERTEGDDHVLDCCRYLIMLRPKPRVRSHSIAVGSIQYDINKAIEEGKGTNRWDRKKPRLMNTNR